MTSLPWRASGRLQQTRIGAQAGHDPGLVQGQIGQTRVAILARRRIEQRGRPEPPREPVELARRDGALPEVDVVDDHPPLAKEAKRRPGRR